MQSTIFFIAILVFVILNLVGLWYLARIVNSAKKTEEDTPDSFLLLQEQIAKLRDTLDLKISETTKQVNTTLQRQLQESTKIVREVTSELVKLSETNKQVVSFADQLQQLQKVLTNPKQRGVLGEYYLETVLSNVLPPESFKMQYAFSDGEVVDAVVFVKDKIIPIDSKFSLENYNRMIEAEGKERLDLEKVFLNDLKLRIKETAKYIRPSEKTVDFAFMFIPSEGIYYDLITNKVGAEEQSLIERAASKYKVIIVSPTSFLAYLQTVLQGLKALEIEKRAEQIIKNVEKLGMHIKKYDTYYQKLGNQLSTVVNHYNAGYKELAKIDKDIVKIAGGELSIEANLVEKPSKLDELTE